MKKLLMTLLVLGSFSSFAQSEQNCSVNINLNYPDQLKSVELTLKNKGYLIVEDEQKATFYFKNYYLPGVVFASMLFKSNINRGYYDIILEKSRESTTFPVFRKKKANVVTMKLLEKIPACDQHLLDYVAEVQERISQIGNY